MLLNLVEERPGMTKQRYASLRLALSLLMAFMLMTGSTVSIFAQATPDATDGAGPALGDTVVIPDANGDPALQVAISEFNDPDDEVDGADRGFHYVSMQLTVNNPTDSDIEFNSYAIQLVDGEGFTSSQTFVSRDSDDYDARPDFSESTIPAGESVSGWVFYQVINGAEPAWVIYQDSFTSQQFVVLANLAGTELAEGDAVPFYDADAEEIGTITVNEVIMDFQKVDSSIDVDRGTTAVAIDLTIENTSDSDLAATPTFYVVDDYGFIYYQSFSFRDAAATDYPDLPYDPPLAGESISGVLIFNIAKGAEVSYVLAQPDYTQMYIVAQPGPGSVVSGDTLTPVPVDTTDDGSTDDDSTDDGSDDDGSTGGVETGDCVGVNDWVNAVSDELGVFSDNETLNGSFSDADPSDLRDAADQMRDAANAVEDIDAPDVAQDTEDEIVSFINGYADIIDDAADRIDDGDDPATVEDDIANNPDFFQMFDDLTTSVTALDETCPDSNVDEVLN